MTHKIADAHNNEAGLATVSPQPVSPGILFPRRFFSVDRTPYNDGSPFTRWIYSMIPPETYAALLSTFGLTTALYNDVTVSVVGDDRTTFANYNGRIIKPEPDKDVRYRKGFYRDVMFLIVELVAI